MIEVEGWTKQMVDDYLRNYLTVEDTSDIISD